MDKCTLVTGGTGYIGSHTTVALLEAGYQVIIVDNLVNSSDKVLSRIEKITGLAPIFVRADLRDTSTITKVFKEYPITSVVHFAGLKAVKESVEEPTKYYDNNLGSALSLVKAMETSGVSTLVFSSSATVYSPFEDSPVDEGATLGPTNPYGMTKYFIERMLTDVALGDKDWSIGLLRYFNPIGAHSTGLIGEMPRGTPNNLVPYVMQVAIEKLEKLYIFGDDYETPDGTCIRDYVHVVDLARGHLAALRFLEKTKGSHIWNLGTGKGTSVLELIQTVEEVIGKSIPKEVVGRRSGDVPIVYADAEKASEELSWRAENTILKMCADHWNWQKQNPDGYQ
ncbi:MAG: UDP-glucose 4-epimerase GalE [Acidimicrobiaceae bacterium]|nr:UDP-glucose 4-epimerase GalE [Acidimicrobiaceae bacterium]|tara:strand:- start:413 stop:1429 length:1017 start_codon:yes stop_codon:yes gene_type:complete